MVKLFVVLVTFVGFVMSDMNAEHKLIETNNGKVRGLRQTTLIKQIAFYSFKGIPYAKSPTGELRFKAPEPIESWAPAILDASKHGKICYQKAAIQSQSEDCLFLNIYVPADIEADEKLAILVYIHGGGFVAGSGDEDYFGPDFLIEKRVIVVTLNYRLGVFGFMSFGTPEYSGNMGLKDQQLALKWIHSNIEHFSGDSNRITIFGQSAGGVSTHFHTFSSESRKYFRNAIPMSGTVDVFWALSDGGDHLEFAHKIAKDLGEPKHSLDELVEFFKTVPADKLANYGTIDGFFRRTCKPDLAPVIERRDAIRPFIVDAPSDIYEQSKINTSVMFTLNSNEFISFYSKTVEELSNFKEIDANFSLKLPFRDVNIQDDSIEMKRIFQKIRKFYFKEKLINENTLVKYMEMLSDVNFAYGIDKSARQHAIKTNTKTFYYRFDVDTRLNMLKHVNDGGDLPGSGHAGDKCYFARALKAQGTYDYILKNKDDEEAKIILQTIESVTKMLTNFAKYGVPTHDGDPIDDFLPIQGNRVHSIDVTKDGLKACVNPNQEANELWAQIEDEVKQISRGRSGS